MIHVTPGMLFGTSFAGRACGLGTALGARLDAGALGAATRGRPWEVASPRPRPHSDAVGRFRADTDQAGHWGVWERFGSGGWAWVRPCRSRSDAERTAELMNAQIA